jgi:hypothetical protein
MDDNIRKRLDIIMIVLMLTIPIMVLLFFIIKILGE